MEAVGAPNIRSRHLDGLPILARRCRLKWTVPRPERSEHPLSY
jgi:hypothetical protein